MDEIHVSHLLNYTGHKLTLISRGGESFWLPSRGAARLDSSMTTADRVWWRHNAHKPAIPLLEVREREIVGLPEPDTESFFIVSGLVAAASDRDDVVCPGRVVRDDMGKVIGCGALIRVRHG